VSRAGPGPGVRRTTRSLGSAAWHLSEGLCRNTAWQARGVLAAVTTSALGDMALAEPLARALKRAGLRPDAWAAGEQVHGRRVQRVQAPTAPRRLPATDGLATDQAGVVLCVRAADCVPVFLWDPAHGAAAAVHAGWRGARQGILTAAVQRMRKWFSSRPRDLWLGIGPHIRVCCYEVGPEVARHFQGAAIRRRGQRIYLDLERALRAEARRAGVRPRRISAAPYCTGHDPRFYSHRRTGTAKRQAAWLVLPADNRI
jgi:polyphenol oxidase